MKKITFLIILALSMLQMVPAQTLLQGEKMWVNVFGPANGGPPPYSVHFDIQKLGTDTIIAGIQYRILLNSTDSTLQQWNIFRFMRETPEGKVFYLNPNTANPERLCYDFGAQVGDTINFYNISMDEPNWGLGGQYSVVNEIDSIYLAGKNRKILSLDAEITFPLNENWIEGIGSSTGFVYNGLAYICGGFYRLNCYFENDNLLYHNPDYPVCYMNWTNIKENPGFNPNVSVNPNPVNDISILKIPIQQLSVGNTLRMYNTVGQCVKQIQIPPSGEIEIRKTEFNPGLYLYCYPSGTGKFIVP